MIGSSSLKGELINVKQHGKPFVSSALFPVADPVCTSKDYSHDSEHYLCDGTVSFLQSPKSIE